MPAQFDTGFFVRQPAWHGQGLVLGDYPGSWDEARKQAGLEWDPILVPQYGYSGIDLDTNGPVYEPGENTVGTYTEQDDFRRVVRSDTGKQLASVSDTYALIDNGEMGQIVESVLDLPNVKWETAGVLDEGRAVWCLAVLDEPIELPGDQTQTYPYMAITNRHDAHGGCTLRATAIRIVCANTFRAAELEGKRTGATFSFVHSKGWRDRMQDARDAVTGARREFAAYEKLATDLLAVQVTPRQREIFVKEFIPAPPTGMASPRVLANVEASRTILRGIMNSKTTAHVAHTAYGLVQGAGEYLDHARTARSWETRLNRQLLKPEPLKAKARRLAFEVASA